MPPALINPDGLPQHWHEAVLIAQIMLVGAALHLTMVKPLLAARLARASRPRLRLEAHFLTAPIFRCLERGGRWKSRDATRAAALASYRRKRTVYAVRPAAPWVVIYGGKWQGTFAAIWPGGLMRDSAGAAAEHLHDPDDD